MAAVKQADEQGRPRRLRARGDLRGAARSAARRGPAAAGVSGAFACVALAVGLVAPPAASGGATGLEALLAEFAAIPGLAARFREERHLAVLHEPLVSSGALYLAPPDGMLRRVDDPVASAVLVEGSRLVFRSSGNRRTLDLDNNPAVRVYIDTFRLLLAGDIEALREIYRIEFEAGEDSAERVWLIRLRPLHSPLAEAIASVEIAGRGRTLGEFRLKKVRGDETVTRFSEVDTTRRFGDGELAEMFRLSPP
jgi:hypothetical protein